VLFLLVLPKPAFGAVAVNLLVAVVDRSLQNPCGVLYTVKIPRSPPTLLMLLRSAYVDQSEIQEMCIALSVLDEYEIYRHGI